MPEVLGVAHLEGELADRDPVPAGGDRRRQDVDARSEMARVMSDSRPVRSSASTWMATRNSESSVGDQRTSTSRSGSESSRWRRLMQSERWTDTPWPRVTNPVISSPGTGVQQRDSLAHTSASPSTTTPESPVVRGRGGRAGRSAAWSRPGLPARPRRRRRRRPAWSPPTARWRGPPPPPRTARTRPGSAARSRWPAARPRWRAAAAAVPACASSGRSRSCRPRRPPPGAPWRTSAGSCSVARALLTKPSQSRLGAASCALEVKISTVSPLSRADSSATSLPFTRAPIVRCPTSVWMA